MRSRFFAPPGAVGAATDVDAGTKMTRDLRRLADDRFDLVVVGAGLYGAIAAWDASLRGLSVALIDRGDFGAATSFNSLKTLHGGLRSLQSLDPGQVRLFVRERRALARVAPHLVRPMAFVVPTYRRPWRSATLMRIALAINDRVARDRHDGLADPALPLPAGAVISRAECLRLNPLIDPAGVTGGALWHDYQMHNSERMTLSFVLSAARQGAAVANYVRACGVLRDGTRVTGVMVEDGLTSERFEIRAGVVVNAAGPWAAPFLDAVGLERTGPRPALSRAMNLVLAGISVPQGCGGLVRGRFLFLTPWRDVAIAGTSHDPHVGSPDRLSVTGADVEALLADAREAFPRGRFSRDALRLVHRGLLPAVSTERGGVRLLRESRVVDHTPDGVPGLVSMFGVRYTTARDTAARAVTLACRTRGDRQPPRSRTAETPVIGGDITNMDRFVADVLRRDRGVVSDECLRHLALTYGTRYIDVLQRVGERPELAAPIGPRSSVIGAEIVHAAEAEAAVTLSDALVRRTEAGSAGHPGLEAIACAARLIAERLAWSDARTEREIAELEAFYRLPD
jgi:glycerol-3-phosphate dehydrogenase